MSKTKNKNGSELEHMRGIVREYEKEIRSLQKQLRQLQKYERSQESDKINDSDDTHVDRSIRKLTKPCNICGKGNLVETLELMGKVYGECNCCGFKSRMDN